MIALPYLYISRLQITKKPCILISSNHAEVVCPQAVEEAHPLIIMTKGDRLARRRTALRRFDPPSVGRDDGISNAGNYRSDIWRRRDARDYTGRAGSVRPAAGAAAAAITAAAAAITAGAAATTAAAGAGDLDSACRRGDAVDAGRGRRRQGAAGTFNAEDLAGRHPVHLGFAQARGCRGEAGGDGQGRKSAKQGLDLHRLPPQMRAGRIDAAAPAVHACRSRGPRRATQPLLS